MSTSGMRLPIHIFLIAFPTLVGLSAEQAGAEDPNRLSRPPGEHSRVPEFELMLKQSMERMHADMALRPTGDPDRDFALMMIPHHQGAIDMARAQLLYGRDPVLRHLAQGIIVEQQQEIEVMQRALRELPPSSHPRTSPDRAGQHHHHAEDTQP